MKKKLKTIMLIDDDQATKFIIRRALKKAECCERIIEAENGKEALEELEKLNTDPSNELPELIFLDINMPRMNGWEFLEEYKSFSSEGQKSIVIVMLTSSLNPEDRARAEKIAEVSGFENKPITLDSLTQVMEKYFGTDS